MTRRKARFKFKGGAVVFIDYANIKAWAADKKLFVDLKILYQTLKASGATKIIFYYGTDPQNPASFAFFNKLRTFGFEIVTKPVKYLKISLLELLNKRINRQLLEKLSSKTRNHLISEVKKLETKGVKLLSPKANFDVEIALDMILFSNEFENFILFSGDGDFTPVVKHLRSKGKKIVVVSGRKFLAGELLEAANKFITLERFSSKTKGLLFLKKARLPKGSLEEL